MKYIRNPKIYWAKLDELATSRKKAVIRRKKRSNIDREMRMITTALLAFELRNADALPSKN